MSGHSKWATIKRKKGRIDDARGKVFTKISKELFVAVRQGGPDPDGNFRLRLCIQKAKAANMPSDNIKHSIQKAAGALDGDNFEELFYEGYGAGGTAILCSIMTDNRNRAASEIRYLFSRNGGNLGETGCVNWMFDRKGQILLNLEDKDADEAMMVALEAGVEDFSADEDEGEVVCSPDDLEAVREALLNAGYEINNAEITMLPSNWVEITDEEIATKVMRLVDALDDNDDVQAVYHNAEIPEDMMENLDY